MLCYVMLSHVMLCYVMLCHVVIFILFWVTEMTIPMMRGKQYSLLHSSFIS